MSLKKFFKPTEQAATTKQNNAVLQVSGSDVVKTIDDALEKTKFDKKIYAFVDISSSLKNYVRYGLAEYHYESGIQRIYNDYPYDGTQAEKYKFLNESNTFDYHIWKDLYPKTTGFITLNEDTNLTQRVEVKAGPNSGSVYNALTRQTNNLSFDAEEGVTVEFWAKPNDSAFSGGIFETVDSSGNYFVIYLNNPGGSGVQFLVAKSSSAGGTEASTTFSTLTGYDNAWHHYALTFELDSSNKLVSTLFVDGVYTEQKVDSNTVSTTVNSISGNVGFAQTYYYTGSIDEFRYWKTKRTEKQIGLNWNTHVDGASNVSGTVSFPLSLYLKFNEGITNSTSIDSTVLDYSGRIASASILNYLSSARSTGSAINEYTEDDYYEVPDPIVYSSHPTVQTLESDKVRDGRVYDNENPHSVFQLMPEWIREQDTDDLKFISHIVGARFDELYAQISSFEKIKRKDYQNQDLKVFPFYQALVESEGFDTSGFLEGEVLTELADKTNIGNLTTGSLPELKNFVYRNIYNNLMHLYKKKGTNSAIRNLLNCYNIDQELLRVREFSNNTTTTIENREFIDNFKDKTIDFYGLKNLVGNKASPSESTIFNFTSSDSNNQSFVTGGFSAYSIEANVYFPTQQTSDSEFYIGYDTSGSIFGVHAANPSAPTNTTFFGDDNCGMAVYAVHGGKNVRQAKFVLSSSNGVFTAVESETYDIFNSTNWNLAAIVEPDGDPRNVTTATNQKYIARLIGYQVESGYTVNSFNLTSSLIDATTGSLMTEESKRVFVGAQRTNFTGSITHRSYARIGNCKFYGDSLEEDEVFLHAKYKNSDGRLRPFENVNRKNKNSTIFAPQYLSKVFEWDFEQVESPNASGQFEVKDTTSASLSFADAFGIYGTAASKTYYGFGFSFPTGIKVFENESISKVRLTSPEESTAANVINSQGQSEITFKVNEAASKDAMVVAKSMNDVISMDILKSFAGITDFNYLIGSPVNKYRLGYKDMEALRRIYFDSVENNPTLEKFTKYFKWFDSVADTIINNLLPATAKLASDSPNIVESHVLERNRYPLKYPTLEFKTPDPTGTINSIVSVENIKVRNNLLQDRRTGAQGSYNFASSSARTPNYVSVYEIGAEQPLSGNITPVSIVNKQTTTTFDDSRREGSVASKNFASSTVGNYNKGYEVVQAVGQKGAFNGKYLANEAVPSVADTEFVSGTYNYKIVNRDKYKTVIRSIFNAPGSPETMHGALDLAAREFSVYNNLNYRNLIPRDFLRDLLILPSAFGGYQSGSTVTASYHKTYRNGYTRKVYSGANIVDKKVFDNYYVQTQIPGTDLQYAWIADSYDVADINRYQTSSQFAPNEQITFVSESNYGAYKNGNFGYFGITAESASADSLAKNFLAVDFAGLNSIVLEPLTASQNYLGNALNVPIIRTATNSDYLNDDFNLIVGAAQGKFIFFNSDDNDFPKGGTPILNALLLNRNGPYGYPSWRAYRKDSHPVVRAHRASNTISFITGTQTFNFRGFVITTPNITNVTQTPVNTTDPLFLRLVDTTFDLKTSYENAKLGFTNEKLQTFVSDFESGIDKNQTLYDRLRETPDAILTTTLRSNVFPLKNNQFLQLTRARDAFDNKWWRNDRADRQLTNTTNSFGFGIDGATSRWALDGRVNFSESLAPRPIRDASGSGELLNHYSTYHLFTGSTTSSFAPTYARRTTEFVYETCNIPFLSGVYSKQISTSSFYLNTGDALWEVGSQSGRSPFYNSYDNYADELRRRGKDHSIVAEFKISDHIDTYLSNGFDFSAQLSDFLSLTGTSNFSVNRYSSAELSEVVAGLKTEVNLGVRKFGLKAKALLKLLPYEGFYPQQRTLQLAQELSSSYKDALFGQQSPGSAGTYDEPGPFFDQTKQFYEAYVSPGILFNTIKSGLAVDYPLYDERTHTGIYNPVEPMEIFTASVQYFGDYIRKNIFNSIDDAADFIIPADTDADGPTRNRLWDSGLGHVNEIFGVSYNFNGGITRIPFEAILDPVSNFNEEYYNFKPNNLQKLSGSTAVIRGTPKINYSLMANNYFAETVNFFIKRGLTFFEGEAKDVFQFDTTKEYAMDFVISNSSISSVSEFSSELRKTYPDLEDPDVIEKQFLSSSAILTASLDCVMYDRASAFGFPSTISYQTGTVLGIQLVAPKEGNYTPPYYHGFARARYKFKPTQETHTLDEIVSDMTIEHFRADLDPIGTLLADPTFTAEYTYAVNKPDDAMTLSSSFVLDAVVEEKRTKFNEDGDIIDFESFDTPRKKLVIHSKYECPILNFKNVNITRPTTGSLTAPKGMWHQYGEIPNYSDIGVFTRILDVPNRERNNAALTASLARTLGIAKEKKAIGRLATSRNIKEGLVVLPYYVDNTKDQPIRFFELTSDTVRKTLKKANRKSVSSADDQLVRQARLMKDYVFPPFLDWVTFSPPDLTDVDVQSNVKKPIMYVFEFSRTLSQQDLANIWQGVLPDAGLTAVEQEAVIDLDTDFASLTTESGAPIDVINANIQSLLASGKEPVFEDDVKALNALDFDDLNFFVFKVKKRGEFQYSRITKDVEDDNLQFDFKPFGVQTELPFFDDFGKKRLAYSYNYPYDFCSLIELAKVDAQYDLSGKILNLSPSVTEDEEEPVANINQTVTGPTRSELAAAQERLRRTSSAVNPDAATGDTRPTPPTPPPPAPSAPTGRPQATAATNTRTTGRNSGRE